MYQMGTPWQRPGTHRQLTEEISNLTASEKWQHYLDFQSRFHPAEASATWTWRARLSGATPSATSLPGPVVARKPSLGSRDRASTSGRLQQPSCSPSRSVNRSRRREPPLLPRPRWADERICPCQRQQVPLTPGTPHVSEHCDSQGLSSLGGRGTLLLVPRTLQCADWAKQCRQDHCLRRFVPRTPSCFPSSSAPLDSGTWNKPQGHRSQIRVWWRGS
jgi:hypothetical protein